MAASWGSPGAHPGRPYGRDRQHALSSRCPTTCFPLTGTFLIFDEFLGKFPLARSGEISPRISPTFGWTRGSDRIGPGNDRSIQTDNTRDSSRFQAPPAPATSPCRCQRPIHIPGKFPQTRTNFPKFPQAPKYGKHILKNS